MPTSMLAPAELDQLLTTLPDVIEMPDEPASASPFLRLLATMAPSQRAQLMTTQPCRAGEVIFREGAVGDAMYIVLAGLVAVIKGDFQAPTWLGYRGPGEVIGEMALVEDQPRSASVIALRSGRLLCIDRQNFMQLVKSQPDMSLGLLKMVSARLRAADSARQTAARQAGQLATQVSQLQTENQQLLELQQLREEMSHLLIHDLRTPLNGIRGVLELLPLVLSEEAVQPNRELLEIANQSCDRLLQLVDTLLEVARLEAGEMHLELTELSLPDLVTAVTRRVPALADGTVKLRVAVPGTLPMLLADQSLLDRVLTNLLDNALKYTPPGPQAQIMVGAVERGGQILVSVMDAGPGVPAVDRERIFKRFAQAAGEKRRRRGFGLGLVFCRLAVEAHGGHIWVEAGEGGVGSRFVFTLPAAPKGAN